jgi:hypothetical protein
MMVRAPACGARPSTVIVSCAYCQHDMAASVPHREGRLCPMPLPAVGTECSHQVQALPPAEREFDNAPYA